MNVDLQFAADAMASNYGSMRELRQGAVRALRELKSRWARVSTRLRHLQPDAVRTATQQRDLGLLGLLVVLLSWGDVTMPLGFVQGLPAAGLAPPYGIFLQQPALPIALENVFFDCEARNSEIKASLKPGLRDEFLLSQSVADAEAGFCTPPLTWSQLLRATQGKPIRLIPRCVIQQSSGKQRIVDNAHAGGQSAFSSESNFKLVLCSALRPAQHAALAISAFGFDRAKEVLQHDGGEDWPNASARTWRPPAHFWGWTLTSVRFRQMVQLPSGFGLATAERTGVLPPGVASKLYGVLNFLEQGVYGRVGTGGLQGLKARQTEKVVELTSALRQSMEVIRAVLALRPRMFPGKAPGASCWFGALAFPLGKHSWPRCRPRCIHSLRLATTRLRSSSCRWCSMPLRRALRASVVPGASGTSITWRPSCVSFVDAVILPIWNGWPT